MLMHFEADLGPTTKAPVQTTTLTVTSQVEVVTRPSEARGFVGKADALWEWTDLRDYIVNQIEQRFGTFPRDFKKESGIFKAFLARHGDKAPAIARFAFEVEGGYWSGAPISVNRFCKGSDAFFSDPIKARLVDVTPTGW